MLGSIRMSAGKGACLLRLAIVIAVMSGIGVSHVSQAMQPAAARAARVRIIHGIGQEGALDVYVDGSLALIGIVFGETSAVFQLSEGDHAFALAPTGASLAAAIAEGTITLQGDTGYYVPLLGSGENASVGLFAIDERPLPQGRSRFRVISGVPDADALVPAFAGGDALSEPLDFGDASAYAVIDAGTYDLEIRDATSGASRLSLPQTPFVEAAATDIVLVGQVADGTMTALIESAPVTVERATGLAAQIVAGACGQEQSSVVDLGMVQPGQGEEVGEGGHVAVAQDYALAAAPFATLVGSAHAITVSSGSAGDGGLLACGNIAGRLNDTGSLVIALEEANSGRPNGVAVLAPGLEDPETTGVSIFLSVGGTAGAPAATPQAASG